MNSENNGNKKPEPDCSDFSCCGSDQENPSSASCCQPSQGNKNTRLVSVLKTSIFLIVVLAAIGIAFNSVLKKSNKQMKTNTGSFQPMEKESGIVAKTPKKTEKYPEACKPCGIRLESLRNLDQSAAGKNFIYIILTDKSMKIPEETADIIERASGTITRKGVKNAVFTLDTGTPDYRKIIGFHKIKEFPAVLSMYKGCGSDLVRGEITEGKLLASYMKASKPRVCGPKSCKPGACP